jgi:hypothetical protein
MRRHENWDQFLYEYLKVASERLFSWKEYNCCFFVGEGIEAMTGLNIAESFPSENVKGEKSAYAALKNFAGGGISEMAEKIAKETGIPEIHVSKAQRGDVVYRKDKSGEMLGLVDLTGKRAVFLHITGGLCHFPIMECIKAWRV